MSRKATTVLVLILGFALVLASAPFASADADRKIVRVDFGVPHVSTVPANFGEPVRLYVREVFQAKKEGDKSPKAGAEVVLFIHGGTVPSVPDYDLQFKDYSWSEFLARAGFDVFMMDQTGYGFSPRPQMNDPCNTNPAQQALLVPNPLAAPCPPSYPFNLTSTQSDVDEINTVVDYIRALRGVQRVNLVGWSGGGPRIGVFAAQYPGKVDRLLFLATGVFEFPAGAWPMNLQSRPALYENRWDSEIGCEDQFDPEIRPVLWDTIMAFDPLGSTWGTPSWNPIAAPTGGLMRFPSVAYRFTPAQAAQIQAPSLLVVGELDAGLLPLTRTLYDLLGTPNKVLIEVACASHFLPVESQHTVLLEASKAWFQKGRVKGIERGVITVDAEGKYHKP